MTLIIIIVYLSVLPQFFAEQNYTTTIVSIHYSVILML